MKSTDPHKARRRLGVSLLLLLLALAFYWAMTNFAMPTPALAHRRAAAEYGLDAGEVLLSRPVRFSVGGNDYAQHWVLSRSKEGYLVSELYRVGLLWNNTSQLQLLRPAADRPLLFCKAASGSTFDSEDTFNSTWEYVTLVLTDDPAVARVELYQALTRTGEAEEVPWLLEHVTPLGCTETAPGSGIWVGQQALPRGNGFSTTYIRAYDSGGTLLYDLPPDLWLRFDRP